MFFCGLIGAMGGRCFQDRFKLHCSVVRLLGDWTISVEFDSAAGYLSVDRQAAWRLIWRCWNIVCFCQAVWQGLLWHSVVKLLGGRVHLLTNCVARLKAHETGDFSDSFHVSSTHVVRT